MVKLLGIFISSVTQRPTTAGGDDRRALHSCQRLAVGAAPPYNQSPVYIVSCDCDGGHHEFAAAAFQKRRSG